MRFTWFFRWSKPPPNPFQFSLWDSPYTTILKDTGRKSFNSLYEILSDSKLFLKSNISFNSLYEIPCNNRSMTDLQMKSFNSLYEILLFKKNYALRVIYPLSILFMRFNYRLLITGNEIKIFQFSLWDSSDGLMLVQVQYQALSILFMRFNL